jgi:hypothetical protein
LIIFFICFHFYFKLVNAQSTNETHHERKVFPIPVRHTSELEENMSDINQEFVSEDYDTSAINMEDIRRDIEQSSTKKSSGKIILLKIIFLDLISLFRFR